MKIQRNFSTKGEVELHAQNPRRFSLDLLGHYSLFSPRAYEGFGQQCITGFQKQIMKRKWIKLLFIT